jgi:RNA polymerase sigma-54 factor
MRPRGALVETSRMQPVTALRHRQQQTLSPRLQHAVRLLQLSSLDFAAELEAQVGRNPFLEPTGDGGDDGDRAVAARLAGLAPAQVAEPEPPSGAASASTDRSDAIAPDGVDTERDAWMADGSTPARRGDDASFGALDLVAAPRGLRPHLHEQLDVLPLPLRDRLLAKAIVESLDDDGYLREPLDGLLEAGAIAPPASDAELQIALRRVQSLDPAGVGARGLAECLRLQLGEIDCPRLRATARVIVDDHLDSLAARDVAGLAQRLGESPAHVEAACERIRHLDPRPGWRHDAAQTEYVTPDIVVKRIRGQWTAMLNPAVVPRVRLHEGYAELFQRHRSGGDGELAGHLQEARWALRNVEQRFGTILAVAQSIVRRQRRFLELGPIAMRPLGLKEIADETGMHESTVSRVTNNKYMATPLGVFELKHFFSRAMTSTSGNAYSGTAIRGLIREMIDEERPQAPLSDVQIARLLAQQGLTVARRTVTKYRQALHIEPVERRRMI